MILQSFRDQFRAESQNTSFIVLAQISGVETHAALLQRLICGSLPTALPLNRSPADSAESHIPSRLVQCGILVICGPGILNTALVEKASVRGPLFHAIWHI